MARNWRRYTNAWPGLDVAAAAADCHDRELFHASGLRALQNIEAALSLAGREVDSFTSILDFGCGFGQILMWLGDLSTTAPLHGVDADPAAAQWAQHHIPYATITKQSGPPLDYDQGFFDLVYSGNFNKLDAASQRIWLDELGRVTRPGGMLVLQVTENALPPIFSTRATNNQLAVIDRIEAKF